MNFSSNSRLVAGTAVDRSRVADTSAQLTIAANANRLGYQIYNPLTGLLNPGGDKLYIKFDATVSNAGNSWELGPGSYFPPPWFPGWNGDIYVLGVSGIKYTAEEYT